MDIDNLVQPLPGALGIAVRPEIQLDFVTIEAALTGDREQGEERQPLPTGRRACIGSSADVQAQASKRQQTQLLHRDDFPMTLG